MKKIAFRVICILFVFLTGCSRNNELFVKNISIARDDNNYIVNFLLYDFSSDKEQYQTIEVKNEDLNKLFVETVNENSLNFRLCENIFIDAIVLKNNINNVFYTVTTMKMPPSVNIFLTNKETDIFTDTDDIIKTQLYNFSKDIYGVDGIIPVIDSSGKESGAIIIDDGNPVKYLENQQLKVFNMLTGDRSGFYLALRDNQIAVLLDKCDVYYAQGKKIVITVKIKDFKGISDDSLMKNFLETEILNCAQELINDPIIAQLFENMQIENKTVDIQVNII